MPKFVTDINNLEIKEMINCNDKNKCYKACLDSEEYILKKYKENERYKTEIKYLRIFRKKEFNVPQVITTDLPNKIIVMEKINDTTKDHHNVNFNRKKIIKCLNILLKIISEFGLEFNKREIINYVERVEKNILKYIKDNTYNLNPYVFKLLINDLKKNCFISIFKDAKPKNWIFTREKKLFLIDFDYVKRSFFLSDLAQFMTYLNIENKLDINFYLNYFLHKVFNKTIVRSNKLFFNLFLLAMINSNISSMMYNKNLSTRILEALKSQTNILLKKIKIVYN